MNRRLPFFSVVMPVFNRGDLVLESINSIFAQSFDDYEVIVVDDGSTDNTVEVIEKLQNVKLLKQENSGPGSARNLGASVARGKYLAFLDSDDCWFHWSLVTYAEAIRQNNFPAFVTGKPFVFTKNEELQNVADGPIEFESFPDYLHSGDEWRWFGVSSFVIRKDCFEQAGGFSPGRINSEDAELALRLGDAKGFVHVTNPQLFGYRQHVGNVTNDHVKSKLGLQVLMNQEHSGKFPGGKSRKAERWKIISRHVRPFSLSAARQGDWRSAVSFYLQTFAWHLQTLRWKYLISLPILSLIGVVKRLIRPESVERA